MSLTPAPRPAAPHGSPPPLMAASGCRRRHGAGAPGGGQRPRTDGVATPALLPSPSPLRQSRAAPPGGDGASLSQRRWDEAPRYYQPVTRLGQHTTRGERGTASV